jgi:type II secretory pathway component GspD/PulD (secretin)
MASRRCDFLCGLACAMIAGMTHQVRGDEEKAAAAVGPATTPYSAGENLAIEDKAMPVPGMVLEAPAATSKPVGAPANAENAGPTAKPDTPGQASGKPEDGKGKESIKSIHRPAAPAVSPNREEFKVRPDQAGKVRLNFNGQPWQPVLEWVALISGMSLDWQDLPGDSVNLSTRRSYTVPEVRDLINRLLLARGFTMLHHGEVLTIAEVKKIDPSLVPRVQAAELASRDPYEFVRVSFPLISLTAEGAAEELKPMLSPNGRLTPLSETNRLEVMDAVTNVRDIANVLKQESDESQPRSFREFKLKYSRAEEVHRLLSTLLGVDSTKSRAAGNESQPNMVAEQAMMIARMERGRMSMGPQVAMANPEPAPTPRAKASEVSMAVNERNNSILVRARPDKMVVISQVIDAVDIPVSHDDSLLVNLNRMQVYRLAGIDPEPVVKTLSEIGNLEPTTRLEVDKKNSAIIAYASLADHVTIRAVVNKLAGSERKFEVIRLRRLAADYVAGTIEFMMGSGAKKEKTRSSPFFSPFESSRRDGNENQKEFRVDADVEHNRLLLWANPVELASVEALLIKLGEIPAAGSGSANIRVIDGGDPKQTQELIDRIRRAWPAVAPNTLLGPPAQAPEDQKTAPPLPSLHKDSSTSILPNPTTAKAPATRIHLADIRFVSDDKAIGGAVKTTRAADQPPAPPPVKIVVGPDGKLLLSSEDGVALDRLEELATQLATPRKDYRVFRLKYAYAVSVALNLEDFFKDDSKKDRSRPMPWWYDEVYGSQNDTQDDRRLSKRRKLTFISDAETNTILVEGASGEQLKTIDDLIQLYDQPPPTDTQSVRKTEIVHLKYSKAKAVADTVKDVYRDLLSANDKALAGNQRDTGRNFFFSYNDNDKTEQKMPKFKGLLSIGVDEISNSLMVSAPAYLFEHVTRMIKQLDEAASPDYSVQYIQVHGMSAKHMKQILEEAYLHKTGQAAAAEERPTTKLAKPSKGSKAAKGGDKGKEADNDEEKR